MSYARSELELSIRAVDQASGELKKVSDGLTGLGNKITEVDNKQTKMAVNTRDVVTGVAGIATASLSLYNAYDRVQDMTLQVDRANLMVKSSANSLADVQARQTSTSQALTDAEAKLSEAISKYGADSTQAQKAQEALDKASQAYKATTADAELQQEKYNLAVERAQQTQENFNEAIVASALQIVPTAITLVDSFSRVSTALGGDGLHGIITKVQGAFSGLNSTNFSGLTSSLSGINTSLGSVAATAGGLAAALAAVAASAYIGYQQAEEATRKGLAPLPGSGKVPTPPVLGGGAIPGMPSLGLLGQFKDWLNKLLGIGVPVMQHGGIVTKPTLIQAGEAGPEAVIPLKQMSSETPKQTTIFSINLNVAGSVDQNVMAMVREQLKHVVISASSSGAPSESKRITLGDTSWAYGYREGGSPSGGGVPIPSPYVWMHL